MLKVTQRIIGATRTPIHVALIQEPRFLTILFYNCVDMQICFSPTNHDLQGLSLHKYYDIHISSVVFPYLLTHILTQHLLSTFKKL